MGFELSQAFKSKPKLNDHKAYWAGQVELEAVAYRLQGCGLAGLRELSPIFPESFCRNSKTEHVFHKDFLNPCMFERVGLVTSRNKTKASSRYWFLDDNTGQRENREKTPSTHCYSGPGNNYSPP